MSNAPKLSVCLRSNLARPNLCGVACADFGGGDVSAAGLLPAADLQAVIDLYLVHPHRRAAAHTQRRPRAVALPTAAHRSPLR